MNNPSVNRATARGGGFYHLRDGIGLIKAGGFVTRQEAKA